MKTVFLLLFVISHVSVIANGEKHARPFVLPYWEGEGGFDLSEHPRSIVILDFFAYWCVPCLGASMDMEARVRPYFLERFLGGDAPAVHILSINVERSRPERTRDFIRRANLTHAFDDAGGELLAQLGGKALPFFVVLKVTDPSGPDGVEVVYRKNGYDGAEELIGIVESIRFDPVVPESTSLPNAPVATEEFALEFEQIEDIVERSAVIGDENVEGTELIGSVDEIVDTKYAGQSVPQSQSMPEFVTNTEYREVALNHSPSVESSLRRLPLFSAFYVDSEVLNSDDISIASLAFRLFGERDSLDWSASLSAGHVSVDYEPVTDADLVGFSNELDESNVALQFQMRQTPNSILRRDVTVGAYRGFGDHRSLWLDEYYKQQFSQVSGYEHSDPWGSSISTGMSLDTQSRFGILSGRLAFQQDDVAPGYDRPLFQELERGRERLYTSSLTLQQESVVSKNARMRHQLQLTKTTERELRYLYNLALNLAVSENWVLRTEGSATFESVEEEDEDDFSAYSGGVILERDWNQEWYLGFTGRTYSDNGQIETSILISSGPPPLETTHFGVSLRRQTESFSWKLELASYESRFDEVESLIRPFGNLYQNRDWVLFSASLNKNF